MTIETTRPLSRLKREIEARKARKQSRKGNVKRLFNGMTENEVLAGLDAIAAEDTTVDWDDELLAA